MAFGSEVQSIAKRKRLASFSQAFKWRRGESNPGPEALQYRLLRV